MPAVLGVAPFMVAVTAACWVVLTAGPMITRGRLGTGWWCLTPPALALAAYVAWGRAVVEPFTG